MSDDRKSDQRKISESVPVNDFLLRNQVEDIDPYYYGFAVMQSASNKAFRKNRVPWVSGCSLIGVAVEYLCPPR
jgi:hypothetical protein